MYKPINKTLAMGMKYLTLTYINIYCIILINVGLWVFLYKMTSIYKIGTKVEGIICL